MISAGLRFPPLPSTEVAWRSLYGDGAFAQRDLITHAALAKEARARDLAITLDRERLEELDRVGAFCPIAFARGVHGAWRLAGPRPVDDVIFREEQETKPWGGYARIVNDHPDTAPLYSPWQLLYLRGALESGSFPLSVDTLLGDPKTLTDAVEAARPWLEGQLAQRSELDPRWSSTAKLVVRLQNRYWPRIVGTITLLYDPETKEQINPLPDTIKHFDPSAVLAEFGCTAEDVRELYVFLARYAQSRDPLARLYPLARMAPRPRYERLSAEVRQVADLYDACEILRLFHHDLTGELLPDCDQIDWLGPGDPPTPRSLRRDKEVLRRELERHRLYPHRVHVFTEGQTEQLVISGLLAAFFDEPTRLGIEITDLGGTGQAKRSRRLLESLGFYTETTLLVFDRENDIVRDIDRYIDEGVLVEEQVELWERSFEEDNFSDEELVGMASRLASEAGVELKLDAATLRERYEDRRDRQPQNPPGIGEVLLELARHPERGSVQLSKPQLAEEMVRLLIDDSNDADDDEAVLERRPILRWLFYTLRRVA